MNGVAVRDDEPILWGMEAVPQICYFMLFNRIIAMRLCRIISNSVFSPGKTDIIGNYKLCVLCGSCRGRFVLVPKPLSACICQLHEDFPYEPVRRGNPLGRRHGDFPYEPVRRGNPHGRAGCRWGAGTRPHFLGTFVGSVDSLFQSWGCSERTRA